VWTVRSGPVWICLCEAVTSGTICDAIESGATTVTAVGEATAAGTVCGRCARNIKLLIDQRCADEGKPRREKGSRWRRAR